MSVLCKICEFRTSGVDGPEVSLLGGNALKPSLFLPRYAAYVLSHSWFVACSF
jgi:hypothetical protein